MGKEITILKELATISMTSAELASVHELICDEIDTPDFNGAIDDLMSDMVNTYQLVLDNLYPFARIASMAHFEAEFTRCYDAYITGLNRNLSIPRINAELTYEKTLQFRKRWEVKTSYPILKIAFARLLEYIDKWHDNDIWLSMNIDLLLKTWSRFISDVNELRQKDSGLAFAQYDSVARHLPGYLHIIQRNIALERSLHTPLAANQSY